MGPRLIAPETPAVIPLAASTAEFTPILMLDGSGLTNFEIKCWKFWNFERPSLAVDFSKFFSIFSLKISTSGSTK